MASYKTCRKCKIKKRSALDFYPRWDGSPKDRCIDCEWKAARNARPSYAGIRR